LTETERVRQRVRVRKTATKRDEREIGEWVWKEKEYDKRERIGFISGVLSVKAKIGVIKEMGSDGKWGKEGGKG